MRAFLVGPLLPLGKKTLSILNGLKPKRNDLRVGVDGGVLFWVESGFPPDFAVGDWDSLTERTGSKRGLLRDIPHQSLPQEKDRSDLFFAAKAAVQAGAQELICLGVTGGPRLDHHLAMLFDLAEVASGKFGTLRQVRAIGEEADYWFLSDRIPVWKASGNWLLKKNQLVSLFALGGSVSGVTLEGFKYKLDQAVLSPSSHGLSNVALKRNCEVHLRKGRLLVIIPRN